MKAFFVYIACLIGFCPQNATLPETADSAAYQQMSAQMSGADNRYHRSTLAGNYLASRFAQRSNDWDNASTFGTQVLKHADNDLDIQKRVMILAMGAGQAEESIAMAREVLAQDPDNPLALLFISIDNFKSGAYQDARNNIANTPTGSLSPFILPILESWSDAALGEFSTDSITNNILHTYHVALITEALDDISTLQAILDKDLSVAKLSEIEIDRFAQIHARLGQVDEARALYQDALDISPHNVAIKRAMEALDNDANNLRAARDTDTAIRFGVSEALYDMARILYQDNSDESGLIFGNLALYLAPDNYKVTMLLGQIALSSDQYTTALKLYRTIPTAYADYAQAQQAIARIYEEQERIADALAVLKQLVDTQGSITSLMQIGDIYRRDENFENAIAYYNKAQDAMGGEITPDYWQLHYVRGMAYEQVGKWDLAEADLEAALAFEPDNPYVLNYLGYSWADLGINLKESLEMVQRAVDLEPQDGYITDSLGWAYYRMERYEESIPHLERAVELLPYDAVINDHLGDAYWQVGRKLEARFQWTRAKNYSEDETLISSVNDKMRDGLTLENVPGDASETKAAQADLTSQTHDAAATHHN